MKNHEKMNVYLSNLAVLNAKLHNLHWNVVGINFVAIHNFTEGLYDEAFEQFDAVAEQIKINGHMPIATLKGYLEKATVKEIDPARFSTKDVLETLISDLKLMRALALDIRNDADEDGDTTVVGMFEEYVATYDKHLWFLDAMSQ